MRNHLLKAVRKGLASIVGSATRSPQLSAITFASDAVAGAQAGDLAVLYWLDPDASITQAAISGWTSRELTSNAPSSYGLWTKVLSSSDVSVTFPSGDADGVAVMVVLRGATYAAHVSASGASGLPNPPTITSVIPTDIVLAIGAYESSTELTAPSGFTRERWTYSSALTPSAVAAVWATGLSGSVNPGAFGGSGAPWRAVSIRIAST